MDAKVRGVLGSEQTGSIFRDCNQLVGRLFSQLWILRSGTFVRTLHDEDRPVVEVFERFLDAYDATRTAASPIIHDHVGSMSGAVAVSVTSVIDRHIPLSLRWRRPKLFEVTNTLDG